MTMTFKEYLTTDEAEAYLSSKSTLPATFGDLQQLERVGKIKPCVYLHNVGFEVFFVANYESMSGYFIPDGFMLLDRYRCNPYRDWFNIYYEIMPSDLFKVIHITEYFNHKPSNDEIGRLLVHKDNPFDDKWLDELLPDSVLIKRSELDALFENASDDKERTNKSENDQPNLEPMHPRERNTAIKIMYALLIKSGLDNTAPTSQNAGSANCEIRTLLDQLGIPVGHETIGKFLADIKDLANQHPLK